MRELEHYRGRDLVGIEELAAAASALIERISPAPARGNVRLYVSVRSARHYLGEGLLGEPSGQAGTATIFNYGNLLRLLAVKKLLVENWSIVKIRELMHSLDLTTLEQYVCGVPSLRREPANPGEAPPLPAGTSSMSPRPVSLFGPAPGPPPLAALSIESARRAASVDWIELAPGLEIRVRRGFRRPRTNAGMQRLIDRFRAIALGPAGKPNGG